MQITHKHLRVALAILGLLGIFWKTSGYFQKDHFIADANAQRMEQLEKKQSKSDERWEEVNKRLSHIEGVLEEMRRDDSWQ